MKKIKYYLLLASFMIIHFGFCDSPLTSTDFCQAYQNEKIVQEAKKANGVINKKIMNYLVNNKKPIAIKLAVINQLSWSIDGKKNAFIFYQFLFKKYRYASLFEVMEKADAQVVICMAYLKALDDYNDVEEALEMANKACEKDPNTYSIQLIRGIIEAQNYFSSNWCDVYNATNKVRANQSLKIDFNTKATEIIFEYMDLYKADCK